MRTRYLLFQFLCLSLPLACPLAARAQEPVYDAFAVDSVAFPKGGTAMLETFLTVNLQKPFMAQVANVTGNVFVKAIVEPNGHLSEVTLVRGIRPDCDAEALRVMRLFNAWKPALKDGKPVRQAITYAIPFKANASLFTKNLDPNRIQQTVYYGSNNQIVTGNIPNYKPTDYQYKVIMPVDTLGRVVGDAKVRVSPRTGYTIMNKTYLLNRERLAATDSTGVRYQVSLKDNCCGLFGTVLTTDEAGKVCTEAQYDVVMQKQRTFSATGLVEELQERIWDGRQISTWYSDGQLKQVLEKTQRSLRPGTEVVRLVAYWDSTGRSWVRDGQGERTWTERVRSRKDTATYTEFVQRASYSEGLKTGLCSGAYADGSYRYEETYANGICQGGYALIAGRDTLRYAQASQMPTLAGGPEAVDQFKTNAVTYLTQSNHITKRGIIWIDFHLDKTGQVLDRAIRLGNTQLANDEALHLFDTSKNLWQPAMVRGEPVQAKHTMVISFDYQNFNFKQTIPSVAF